MNSSHQHHHHHHHHDEHHDVHQQRLLWFFSFCNQRSGSSSGSSTGSGPARRACRRKSNGPNRNKFAIQYQQQLQQQQRQSSNVFGKELIEHTQLFSDADSIPHIVKSCTRFIEGHGIIFGIYRLSGMRVNIHKLRHDFDENPKISIIDSESISNDAHAVACVLKQYFRELPTPLLTFHMYEKFIELFKKFTTSASDSQLLSLSSVVTTTTSDIKYQVKLDDLKQLLIRLPLAHYQTLKFLMRHLAFIAANGPKTGMDSRNVAIVWAPNLLKPRELELSAGLETLQVIGLQAVITEQLIKHHKFLFEDDEDNENDN